jgi:3-oxoacyl-[acyl-carrier protein] reductase
MKNYLDLSGKVALITGASSGIGAATAIVLAELGARVAIGYHRNENGAEEVRDKIGIAGGTAIVAQADVRHATGVRTLVEAVLAKLGPIDILVNNAGSLVERIALIDLTEEKWDEVLDLNLKSALLCSQAVMRPMIERRTGAIVNVTSIAAHTGGGLGASAYSTAKGAMITLTKSFAKELGPFGIRVNAIAPGVIDTPFHEVFSTPEMMCNFAKSIPLGRVGTPMECATVIAFLASEAANYLEGETIEVNGGLLMT